MSWAGRTAHVLAVVAIAVGCADVTRGPVPRLHHVEPDILEAGTSTPIEIFGEDLCSQIHTHFWPGETVKVKHHFSGALGGVALTDVRWQSNSSVLATAPALTRGQYALELVTPSGVARLQDAVTVNAEGDVCGDCSALRMVCAPSGCRAADDCSDVPDLTLCEGDGYRICSAGECVRPGCGDASCNVPGPGVYPPDTSQRLCYDDAAELACPGIAGDASCATTSWCGQDAQVGWDVNHGPAERFERVEPVTDEPVVTDSLTGLLWQGCAAGMDTFDCSGAATAMIWSEALDYCGDLSWGSFDDWRLPDDFETQLIMDFGRAMPAMDLDAFVNTPYGSSGAGYWTSSTSAQDGDEAWYGCVRCAHLSCTPKASSNFVRCVRGTTAPAERVPAVRFSRDERVADEPTVSDRTTGLEWQGCAAGQAGAQCAGTATGFLWREALAHCQDLNWAGVDDWVLPNVTELRSIVDTRRFNPAADTAAFPGMPADGFWSSSTFVFGNQTHQAWRVDFLDGLFHGQWFPKGSDRHLVRCVRMDGG